jgi:soluble P-type ATPase
VISCIWVSVTVRLRLRPPRSTAASTAGCRPPQPKFPNRSDVFTERLDELHRSHIEVIMITGDARAVAEAVGAERGVDQVLAEVLPGDKASKIEALQRQGKRVAMVGDGVNDAPALVTADVGIAIVAGTDVVVDAGDVVLVRSDLRDVPKIVALSRASCRKMVQNLWWLLVQHPWHSPCGRGAVALGTHPIAGRRSGTDRPPVRSTWRSTRSYCAESHSERRSCHGGLIGRGLPPSATSYCARRQRGHSSRRPVSPRPLAGFGGPRADGRCYALRGFIG